MKYYEVYIDLYVYIKNSEIYEVYMCTYKKESLNIGNLVYNGQCKYFNAATRDYIYI